MTRKEKIHGHCLNLINDKISLLQQVLADLKESAGNETKSTAGDKHETALAMLQIEQANTRGQLEDVLQKKAALKRINPVSSPEQIVNGSLVKTNRGYLYLSVALGKINTDGIDVIALSPQSPLGEKMMGLIVGDTVEMNGNFYIIEVIE